MAFTTQVLASRPGFMKMQVTGISVPMANTLRRLMLTKIPHVAIDQVQVIKNDSPIPKEILVHRIGLLPLCCDDIDALRERESCECGTDSDGCADCTVMFELDVTNTTDTILSVTDRDLKVTSFHDVTVLIDEDPVIITKLAPGQRLAFLARAIRGDGLRHVKFSVATTVGYGYVSEVVIHHPAVQRMTPGERQRICEACPKQLLQLTSDSTDIEAIADCTLSCMDCVRTSHLIQADHGEAEPAVQLRHKNNDSFVFNIRTTKAYSPQRVWDTAISVLKKSLEELRYEFQQALE